MVAAESSAPRVGRPLKLGLIATFVVFGLYFLYLLVSSSIRGPASMSELTREFAAINHPFASSQVGPVRQSSKLIAQVVSADFKARLSEEQVEEHYGRILKANGWRPFSSSNASATGWRERRFCKNDLTAVLQAQVTAEPVTRYYFGIRWEGGAFSRTGC